MKKKRRHPIRIGLALLLGLSVCTVGHASKSLVVYSLDGTTQKYNLSDTRKLTFVPGAPCNMIVTKRDNSTTSFPLTSFSKLKFEENITTQVSTDLSSISLSFYPNPVLNELKLHGVATDGKYVNVSIVTLAGNVVSNLNLLSNDELSINVSALPAGVYFCHLRTGTNVMVGKFIKN